MMMAEMECPDHHLFSPLHHPDAALRAYPVLLNVTLQCCSAGSMPALLKPS